LSLYEKILLNKKKKYKQVWKDWTITHTKEGTSN